MWYSLPDSNKQYPVAIERVREIKSLNKRNITPKELEAVELVATKTVEGETAFVDVVGQISLKTLERADKKRRQQQQRKPNVSATESSGQNSKGQRPQNPTQNKNNGGNRPPQNQRNSNRRPPQSGQSGNEQNNK